MPVCVLSAGCAGGRTGGAAERLVQLNTYRTVNTLSVIKTSQIMLYSEIIAVCSQIHTKHTNTVCGQNEEILNSKLVAIKCNH